MEITKGIQKVLDGEGILFLGAGFSFGAKNTRNEPFMTGQQFANYLTTKIDIEEGASLEEVAEEYLVEHGLDALMREVQEGFTAREVCDYHREIASLPWKRVYTTNYDNVFEVASRLEGQRVTPVTMGNDIYKMPKDHRICVHLNGYVDSLDRDKLLSELKLTDTSYVTAAIVDTPWAMLLRQDIRLSSVVFFVGYSMYDLDIKRILMQSSDLQEKLLAYVGPYPDSSTERKVSRYGTILKASTEDFARAVQDVAVSYEPKDRDSLRMLSVRDCNGPFSPVPITDMIFHNLLLWGKRNDNLVAESLRTDKPYYLQRHNLNKVLDLIDDGTQVVVISSDLGNGKTMFLEGLRILAIERGYKVFDLSEHNEGVDREIESLAKSEMKVLLTIEEYHKYLDQIRLFCMNAGNQAVLVLTARNAVHDVLIDDLEVITGDKLISEINIDSLSDNEIEWLVQTLDLYGLWGNRARFGKAEKTRFISVNCRRQLHALLLELISSPDIGARVSSVADQLRTTSGNYEPLLSVFILTLLNHAPTFDILADIWGTGKIYSTQFRNDHVAQECPASVEIGLLNQPKCVG